MTPAITKRTLLSLIGAFPFSAPAALRDTMASPLVKGVLATASLSNITGNVEKAEEVAHGSVGERRFGKFLHRKINNELTHFSMAKNIKSNLRNGMFDPDIACLKSTSLSYKNMKQYQRDIDNDAFYNHVDRLMYREDL